MAASNQETCPTCGAPQGNVAPLYCRSCGARKAGGVDPGFRTDPERYELVTREPAYAGAMKHAPRLGWGDVTKQIAMFAAAAAIAAAGLSITAAVKAGALFSIAFAAICGLVMLVGIYELGVAVARMRAPTERRVAVLVSDRVKSPTQTILGRLRFADGEELTVAVDQALLALVAVGDIGVAYLQRDRLVDFRWFDVMPPADAPGGAHVAPSCPGCAAPITFDSRATCAFCRATLPVPNLGEHAAALHAARAAAARVPQAPARDPRPPVTGPLVMLVVGGLGLYVAVRYQVAWMVIGELWPWIGLFLGIFVPVTIVGAIWMWRRIGPRPPPERALARVVRRRRDVAAEVNGRPVYRYFVTWVATNGAREELQATEAQWQALSPDDVAVVWAREGVLVDLVRVDMPSSGA